MAATVGGSAPGRYPIGEPGAVRWSVAHGSNACPDRVVDKGSGWPASGTGPLGGQVT